MTARFQGPLVDPSTGCVKFSQQGSSVRPADAVDFRGMAVSPDGVVYSIADTGQARVFQDGIAIEPATGLTITGPGPVVNTSMGGLGVNADGAVVLNSPADVIHQGVGLTNAGELCPRGPIPQLRGFGADSNGQIRGLISGDGDLTFARATGATVTNWEGIIKNCLIDELRFIYARRGENLATGLVTETITIINGNDYQLTIAGANGATAVCSGAFTGTLTADGTNRISWPSGTPKTAASTSLTITVTGTLTQMFLEDVTGDSNQNPGENIPVTGSTTNFSYADKVRYYAYEKGNTVNGSGVVTEGKGPDLTTDWGILYEPAKTNYADGADDLSGGAETVDLTAGGTGDFTLSVDGTAAVTVAAGTATGTGFGQATAGNPVAFNLSVTGTVTLTLDSGTLTKVGGLAVKQVEAGTRPTSWIPTNGGTDNRSADDGAPSFDYSNWSQTEGTLVFYMRLSDRTPPAQIGLFNVRNNAGSGVLRKNTGFAIATDDGTDTSFIDIPPNTEDVMLALSVDFGTGSTMEIGFRDVTGSGTWQWAPSPANYDGAYVTDNAINICYDVSTPTILRDLYWYTTRLGKTYIEANF